MKSHKGIMFPELIKEERPSCNGTIEFRIVDEVRKVRTPWLFFDANDHVAACAVNRTDRNKLTHRHTIDDGEWVIVHSY